MTGSGTVQLVIQTTAPQTAALSPRNWLFRPPLPEIACGGILLLSAIALCAALSRRTRLRLAFAVGLIASGALTFSGCGGGPTTSVTNPTGPGTPTNVTYTVNVTATGGAITHVTTFNFIVP